MIRKACSDQINENDLPAVFTGGRSWQANY